MKQLTTCNPFPPAYSFSSIAFRDHRCFDYICKVRPVCACNEPVEQRLSRAGAPCVENTFGLISSDRGRCNHPPLSSKESSKKAGLAAMALRWRIRSWSLQYIFYRHALKIKRGTLTPACPAASPRYTAPCRQLGSHCAQRAKQEYTSLQYCNAAGNTVIDALDRGADSAR